MDESAGDARQAVQVKWFIAGDPFYAHISLDGGKCGNAPRKCGKSHLPALIDEFTQVTAGGHFGRERG